MVPLSCSSLEASLGLCLGQREATHWHPCLSQHVLELEAKMDQLRTMVEAADREKVELLNQLEEEKRWPQTVPWCKCGLFLLNDLRKMFSLWCQPLDCVFSGNETLCTAWGGFAWIWLLLRSLESSRHTLLHLTAVYWVLAMCQTSFRGWPQCREINSNPAST